MCVKKVYDLIVIGAGAAGLMCAFTAGRRGMSVLLLERNKKPGAKILISGGGRCNFTNERISADAYISDNPHFVKSALARYTYQDFLDLIAAHGLTWHEKTLGQLFCDQGSKAILSVLLKECDEAGVELQTAVDILDVERADNGFSLKTDDAVILGRNLVVASGGLSIPKMGATDFGYRTARKFGLKVVEPRPALVPLTFAPELVDEMKQLAGVSADSVLALPKEKARKGKAQPAPNFRENLLFTHRGLSGPAILQISSYWKPGGDVLVNLLPNVQDALALLKEERDKNPTSTLKSVFSDMLPTRLSDYMIGEEQGPLANLSNQVLEGVAKRLASWGLQPTGTEGFKKAEVTSGGVATSGLSSKTMEAKKVPGLYFIGECVDVTGWLGGYNFQWAWASGHAAGEAVI